MSCRLWCARSESWSGVAIGNVAATLGLIALVESGAARGASGASTGSGHGPGTDIAASVIPAEERFGWQS